MSGPVPGARAPRAWLYGKTFVQSLNEMLVMGSSPGSEQLCAPLQEAAGPPFNLSEDRYQLGRVFLRCGMTAEAAYQFVQGLRANPQDERGYYALGRLAAQQGKRRMAQRVLELGLRHVPDSWSLRHALAGLSSVSRVSREQQKAQGALLARALCLREEGLSRVALALMANAFQKGIPPSADLKVLEAELLENLSPPQPALALHAYEAALTLEPGHGDAFNQMVLLVLRQDGSAALVEGKPGQAQSVLQ